MYGFSQMTFIRKVRYTNIHSFRRFIEILFCKFWYINRTFLKKIFFHTWVDLLTKMYRIKFKKLKLVSMTFIEKSHSIKTIYLKKSTNLSHLKKNLEIRAKSKPYIFKGLVYSFIK